MRLLPRVSVLVLLWGTLSTTSAQAPEGLSSWRLFQDAVTGISFRYPPEWQLASRPCAPGDLWGCLMEAGLLPPPSQQNPFPLPALEVNVHACSASNRGPGVPCANEAVFKTCERFHIGNAAAFECIDFDSETCHWSAYVPLDGSEILLSTPHLDEEARKGASTKAECAKRVIAHRNTLPLKEVLASFSIPLPQPSRSGRND